MPAEAEERFEKRVPAAGTSRPNKRDVVGTRRGRKLVAALGLVAVSVGSVRAFRGSYKPFQPDAPVYRQHGPTDAPAVLAVFSDFQCPSCAYAVDSVRRLESLYPGQIRVVFKHHPWYFHPYARQAALMTECAGKLEGKFWPLHDKFFEQQSTWAHAKDPGALLEGYAKELRVDSPAFAACRKDPATAALVDQDLKEAKDHWISGTPTFFVNGIRCSGPQQLKSTGIKEIERAIKARKTS